MRYHPDPIIRKIEKQFDARRRAAARQAAAFERSQRRAKREQARNQRCRYWRRWWRRNEAEMADLATMAVLLGTAALIMAVDMALRLR